MLNNISLPAFFVYLIGKELEQVLAQARRYWVLILLILVLLAFIVPFTLLTDVEKVYGAFLFWSLFAVVTIYCLERITRRWRD